MGSLLSHAFIDPNDLPGCAGKGDCDALFSSADSAWGLLQTLSLAAAYGYVLFCASNLLSEGSELLLLVPSIAGIVGSVVLPVLGAVPDGAIMLFSGLGEDAQSELQVGVGALAGSTIMLLTLPWGLSVYYGRVPLSRSGVAQYRAASRQRAGKRPPTLCNTGVAPEPSIRENAVVMVATALAYLVIQGPAMQYATGGSENDSAKRVHYISSQEHYWALCGLVLSLAFFCGYLVLMVRQGQNESKTEALVDRAIVKALTGGKAGARGLTLPGLLAPILENVKDNMRQASLARQDESNRGLSEMLLEEDRHRLRRLFDPFFHKYDRDGNGTLSPLELSHLLADLGEQVSAKQANEWMRRLDPDGSGAISQDEFLDAMLQYVQDESTRTVESERLEEETLRAAGGGLEEDTAVGAEGGGEVEVPEDVAHLDWHQQQRVIKRRAALLMAVGTGLVLLFSDPMVDVLSNLGARTGVPPFYISFICAPLASNASELLASVYYARKKTRRSITISLSTLEGAACMNNTFCLAIFMALVAFNRLAWHFTAETLAILVVEVTVAGFARARVLRGWTSLVVLALFPASIALVAGLEAIGLD